MTESTTFYVKSNASTEIDTTIFDNINAIFEENNNRIINKIDVKDKLSIISGAFINTIGYISSNSNYSYIDYLPIGNDELYLEYTINNKYYYNIASCAYYDKYNNFIVADTNDYQNLTSDTYVTRYVEGAYYIRFSIFTTSLDYLNIYISNIIPINNISYAEENKISPEDCDFFEHDPSSNYISGWVDNTYIDGTGTRKSFNGLYSTEPVYLEPNTAYYHSGFYPGYYAFYDADSTVLESHPQTDSKPNPFTTPDKTAYGLFTASSEANRDSAWISKENSKPIDYKIIIKESLLPTTITSADTDNPCNYTGIDIITFTKCLAIGDSLTAGTMNYKKKDNSTGYISYDKYSWPRNFERITGIETTNLGIGGASSLEWWNYKKDTDLSGYDLCIMQLGVNDNIRYTSFGNDSIEGFTNIINKLKEENNNIKIFVANIIPARSYHNTSYIQYSADLLTWLQEYYANDNNVFPLDIQQYGHTYDIDAYNCGHLSAYGYHTLAKDYIAYISYIMSKSPGLFKEVQFIGTDLSYD